VLRRSDTCDDGPSKCEDDKSWYQNNNKGKDKTCKYIKKRLKKCKKLTEKKCKKLTEKECSRVGDDGREAYDACQLTCGTCDAEDAPFKSDGPEEFTGASCADNTSKKSCTKDALGCEWKKKNAKCKPAKGGFTAGGGSTTRCKDNTSRNSCKEDALGCKWKNGKRRRRRRQ